MEVFRKNPFDTINQIFEIKYLVRKLDYKTSFGKNEITSYSFEVIGLSLLNQSINHLIFRAISNFSLLAFHL